jgi:hypothetical protein
MDQLSGFSIFNLVVHDTSTVTALLVALLQLFQDNITLASTVSTPSFATPSNEVPLSASTTNG